MKNQQANLFIIDDNQLLARDLKIYLSEAFHNQFTIYNFSTGDSALKKVDKNTTIVILAYFFKDECGNEILASIKSINPKTEVIMLTSNDDIKVAINAFRNGATDYVIKGDKAKKKLVSIIYNLAAYPVRLVAKEFRIEKYVALYFLTFLSVAALTLLGLFLSD